jgi:hypothetical protein
VVGGVDGVVQGGFVAGFRGAVDGVAVRREEGAEAWEVEAAGDVVEGGVIIFELFFFRFFLDLG